VASAQTVYCDQCGTSVLSTFVKCPTCGGREFCDTPPSLATKEPTTRSHDSVGTTTAPKKYEGLGGWLILVGIGIILNPLRLAVVTFITFMPLFSGDNWEIITTNSAYLGPFILIEIILNCGFVAAYIYLGYLFFTKSAEFPIWFIRIFIANAVFVITDAFIGGSFFPDEPMFDPDTLREVVRSIVSTLIWVPYMLKSKRVKATFVN
jgi:hypothetical protein